MMALPCFDTIQDGINDNEVVELYKCRNKSNAGWFSESCLGANIHTHCTRRMNLVKKVEKIRMSEDEVRVAGGSHQRILLRALLGENGLHSARSNFSVLRTSHYVHYPVCVLRTCISIVNPVQLYHSKCKEDSI